MAHCFARFDTPTQFARYVVPLRPIYTLCVARRAILSARRTVFIDRRPARRMYVSAKFARSLFMRRIRPSAKFNREPCRKKQEPSKAEHPINFTPKDKKRLAQAREKARFRVEILRQAVKKAAI